MHGTASCGMGEQGLSHPQGGLSLSSQFCLLMHTKQSSVLVRVNRQDNFDREQEFRKQWTACKMCIGESPDAPSSVPCCPEDSLWMVYINICPYSTQGLCSSLLENSVTVPTASLGEDRVKSYRSFVSHADNMSVFSRLAFGVGMELWVG